MNWMRAQDCNREGTMGCRARIRLAAALLAVSMLAEADAASRYDELKRVIDRNTGYAHLTRGMNVYTLIALRECVSDADIPVLTQLLSDRDYVTQMTAAGVLADMGSRGRKALEIAHMGPADARTRSVIEDALREADSPTRRPLADYPLTERERRGIRSCGKNGASAP
jgi:hypothetical protein